MVDLERSRQFRCDCHAHMLELTVGGFDPPGGFDEGPWWLEFAVWEMARNGRRNPWGARLRHIWRILRTGSPYSDYVALDWEKAAELSEWLIGALAEKHGPQVAEPLRAVNVP